MKRHILWLVIMSTVIVFNTSCSDSKYPGYELSESGVNYKFHHQSDDTTKGKIGSYVTVNMKFGLADTVLFDSDMMDEELAFPISNHTFEGDLYDALQLMSPGDSMSFVVVADSFYLQTARMAKLPDFVEPGELLYYNISLKRIENKEEYQQSVLKRQQQKYKLERSKLLDYIRQNKITTPPLETGLYYIETKMGSGIKADTGDVCTIRLEVSDLSGRILYSNMDTEIPTLDVTYGEEFDTKGFMQGLGLMRKGGKSKLIVPSPIGVGKLGMQGVDGFTTLIYKVSLEDIKPKTNNK